MSAATGDLDLAPALMQIDLDQLERLSRISDPGNFELVDLARLRQRYRGNPAASRLNALIDQQLLRWNHTEDSLFEATRAIWSSGWRPQLEEAASGVGSGSDVAAE